MSILTMDEIYIDNNPRIIILFTVCDDYECYVNLFNLPKKYRYRDLVIQEIHDYGDSLVQLCKERLWGEND